MKVLFKTDRLRKSFEDFRELSRRYGADNARKIVQRIGELEAATALADMPHASHPHPLDHDRKGTFAVDLKQPYRLVFEPFECATPNDFSTIHSVTILEVTDYH